MAGVACLAVAYMQQFGEYMLCTGINFHILHV